jgi:mono/diheme cytochrome c family protein
VTASSPSNAAPTRVNQTAGIAAATTPRAFVEQHCLTCHNDRARAAGLSLTAAPADVTADAALWEKVLHKVRSGQMPPAGRPRPDAAVSRAVVRTIADTLDRHAALHPQPARVGAHRLNRTEYANAVRDVLALDVDASALLLPDEADDGFDNIAASLALSPAHLERYLAAAKQISRLAVGDRTLADAPASSIPNCRSARAARPPGDDSPSARAVDCRAPLLPRRRRLHVYCGCGGRFTTTSSAWDIRRR